MYKNASLKNRFEVLVSYLVQIQIRTQKKQQTLFFVLIVVRLEAIINERNPPPTNQHVGNSANTKTGHSQKSISM